VNTRRKVESSKPRRKKRPAAKGQPRATFIGTRPRTFTMMLRGQAVEVDVVPAVSTTTHVNFAITIRRGRKILDWVPTRAELEAIGRAAGVHTTQETSQ
jgi:hypothetical protein